MADLSPQARVQLELIKREIATHLTAIGKILPPGYAVTFIARNVNMPNAQIVVTEDNDLDRVAHEILTAGDL